MNNIAAMVFKLAIFYYKNDLNKILLSTHLYLSFSYRTKLEIRQNFIQIIDYEIENRGVLPLDFPCFTSSFYGAFAEPYCVFVVHVRALIPYLRLFLPLCSVYH